MYHLVLVVLIVSDCYQAFPSGVSIGIQPYSQPISHQFYNQDGLGSYVYGYITPQSSKTEFRTHEGLTKGGYSYLDPKGEIQTVEYTADSKNGFRVATTNLPKDDPEVAYAKHKHYEDFERIKAEHAALAREHADLARKLASLAGDNWKDKNAEELPETIHHSHGTSVFERITKNWQDQAYAVALEAHRQASLAQGHNYQIHEEGQEKWEDTWEAQRLRDQQQNQNHEGESHSSWNQNTDQHKAAYEAAIAAERRLIAHASEERERQLQALQQAQQSYQSSISHLEETRLQQQSHYQSTIEAHQEAARRLEEARLQQEHADQKWNKVHIRHQTSWNTGNNQDERHRAEIEAVLRSEQELIARAQEERNRHVQAYQEAIQRYRESEHRLEQTRNQQTAAYESALQVHREAARRLQQASTQHEQAESHWNNVNNNRASQEAASNAERWLIAQVEELRNRQAQSYQQSAKNQEESKREAYISSPESQRESTRRLQEAQQQIKEAWIINPEEIDEARKNSLAEAERAFKDFAISSNNVIQNDIPVKTVLLPALPVAEPKIYAPVQVVRSSKGNEAPQVLNLYSYGSLRIPELNGNGSYSFIDNNGVLQTMQYVSNHLKGFRLSDVNSAFTSIKSDDRSAGTVQHIQPVTQRIEITPQIRQEKREGSTEENGNWEGDSASYTTEIKYK